MIDKKQNQRYIIDFLIYDTKKLLYNTFNF